MTAVPFRAPGATQVAPAVQPNENAFATLMVAGIVLAVANGIGFAWRLYTNHTVVSAWPWVTGMVISAFAVLALLFVGAKKNENWDFSLFTASGVLSFLGFLFGAVPAFLLLYV